MEGHFRQVFKNNGEGSIYDFIEKQEEDKFRKDTHFVNLYQLYNVFDTSMNECFEENPEMNDT